MAFADQAIVAVIVALLVAIGWGIARWRRRSRQIREEQRRHWAVHERARAAKNLTIAANAKGH